MRRLLWTIIASLDRPRDPRRRTRPLAKIAVEAGVGWRRWGLHSFTGEDSAVRVRAARPQVVADLNVVAGYLEAEMMAKAGADLSWSWPRHTGRQSRYRAAKDTRLLRSWGTSCCQPALLPTDTGVGRDYVIVHTGREHNAGPANPIRHCRALSNLVSIRQAVGGLSVEQAIAMPKMGAPLVVIGAPLVIDGQEFAPGDTADRLLELLQHVVREVKAQGRED